MGSTSSPLFHEFTGQEIIDLANADLAGYAGAVTQQMLLSYINEAKDEIWGLLLEENEKYFETSTQSTDTTKINYFGSFQPFPTPREYALPVDFRRMSFIECVTAGFEGTRFIYRPQRHPDWANARRSSNASAGGVPNNLEYYYDIIGTGTITLAQYPAQTIQAVLWYIRGINDVDPDSTVDGIINPYSRKLATYAVQRATLSVQDLKLSEEWKREWKEQCQVISANSGTRQEVDPTFVDDFAGDDI